jgi:CRISPR-associated endonuclease/helicase Cas3
MRFARRTFSLQPQLRTLACLAARWHDLGKYSDAFQQYLLTVGGDAHSGEASNRVDHSSAGAQHAMAVLPPPLNAMVAYAIAGHHAGLLDGIHEQHASLKARLGKQDLPPWRERVPEPLLRAPEVGMPTFGKGTRPKEAAFQLAFASRMLFSCLVDADFLATESFMNPRQAAQRPADHADFAALDRHLADYMDNRFTAAEGTVAEARAGVLAACRAEAEGKPGLYSLSVPTGGGKTLSSLAFALRHCAMNGLDRVIYAIPFTSIIEQTAEVFRGAFSDFPIGIDQLILEHHSNFDPDQETTRSRLASENWDAPLIVTTNVQLFESLFANRTSRCRKLHRIANSVLILDEAQTLPVTLLEPCLRALRLLVEKYGCTVVLCTATQPAIERRDEFPIGLDAATPIIDDAPALYARLKRVTVRDAGKLGSDDLATRMAESEQGLAIVNTRRHAAALYSALKARTGGEGGYHLSAAMTPAHRSGLLDEIRQRLLDGQPCRVVATQLIEAGVDVDFPLVWRALAGLDSIAQAAGRCNREGRLHEAVTWIFRPDEPEFGRLFGTLKSGANAASQVIGCARHADLLGLEAVEHYFHLHYWSQQDKWDEQDICDQFTLDLYLKNSPYLFFNFASVAQRFRFIDDAQRPVVVGWEDRGREQVDELRRLHGLKLYPDRKLSRRLQRLSVTVSQRLWEQALASGQVELLCDRFAVLTSPELYYNKELGLQLDAEPLYDPNKTIV